MPDVQHLNIWGTDKARVPEGYCPECETPAPNHYGDCPAVRVTVREVNGVNLVQVMVDRLYVALTTKDTRFHVVLERDVWDHTWRAARHMGLTVVGTTPQFYELPDAVQSARTHHWL